MGRSRNFIPSAAGASLAPLRYPDCIHLSELCRCKILHVDGCVGEGCSFRQTRAQDASSRERWRKRMNGLPGEAQQRIACDYYGGKLPWRTEKGG